MKKTFWKNLKTWCYKYLGTLFMERDSAGIYRMSLGRVSFVAVLGHSMWIWSGFAGESIALAPGEKEVLLALLAYNFTTKAVKAYQDKKGSK